MTKGDEKPLTIPEPKSAGARVLREILRTPSFRELIGIHTQDFDPEKAGELIRTALREDPNFSLGLAAAAPGLFNCLIEAFVELGHQIDSLPSKLKDEFIAGLRDEIDHDRLAELPSVWTPHIARALPGLFNAKMETLYGVANALSELSQDERSDLLTQSMIKIDPKALAGACNAWAALLIQMRRENPGATEHMRPFIENAVSETDFGKIRVAIEELSDLGVELSDHLTRKMLSNPVSAANLFGVIAPVLNGFVRSISCTLANVDMAAEITASGFLGVIEDIDGKELGKLITLASGLICDIHAGSLVLGLDEPQFKAVFTELADAAGETLDTELLASALLAFSEDSQVVIEALGDAVAREPAFISQLIATLLVLSSASQRMIEKCLRALVEASDEDFDGFCDELKGRLDVKEVGDVVNAATALFNRINEGNPDFITELSARFYESLDIEQAGKAFGALAKNLKETAARDVGIQKALEPEEVGRRINDMLLRFNRAMDQKENETHSYLKSIFHNIDSNELSKAARHVVKIVTSILTSSAQVAGAILRPAIRGMWTMMGFSAGALKRKLLRQDEPGEERR